MGGGSDLECLLYLDTHSLIFLMQRLKKRRILQRPNHLIC